jgi:hypothetical protein
MSNKKNQAGKEKHKEAYLVKIKKGIHRWALKIHQPQDPLTNRNHLSA